jgi:gluconate 2-dehydrogenase gamma chain
MSNMFLNNEEMSLVQAICNRLIPSEPDSPGAKEARADVYIDRVLGGYFIHLQKFYRQRLQDMNRLSIQKYGVEFTELAINHQDEMLHNMDQSQAGPDSANMKLFFDIIYEQTIEGTFGDPMYGGNQDFVGWKLIGFPGAQWGYTSEQMKLGYDSRQIPILSVSELLQKHKEAE